MTRRKPAAMLAALLFCSLTCAAPFAQGPFPAGRPMLKATSEAIANPGFESGRHQGWSESSSGGYNIVGSTGQARSGSWSAWFGGYDNLTESLSQDVLIPADAEDARLSFWYRIETQESPGVAYDFLRMTVADATTGAVIIETTLSNTSAASAYAQSESHSLVAYRGRTVRVSFAATTDFSLPSNFHVDDVSMLVTRADATPPTGNFSDIWFNPGESGWGLTIADHETQLFAVWFTYRQDGSPTWFVIPGGTFSQGRRIFTGDAYQTTGPRYDGPFNASAVTVTRVGSVSLDFAPPGLASGTALFSYDINGVRGSKQIERQPFGNAAPAWGSDVTDIWWNANESGWGLTLAQHGNNVFGVWFTYDTQGRPLFVVMPGVTFNGPSSFSGPLYTTTGPYFGGPFNAAPVRVTQVGSATLDIQSSATSGRRLRWRPTVQGSAIDRQVTPMEFGNRPPGDPPLPQTHRLDVVLIGSGTGTVTSSPPGISCPATCSAQFANGTNVTLTASATGTSRFLSFSGACSSNAPSCALGLFGPASVTARFDPLPAGNPLDIRILALPDATPGVFYEAPAAEGRDGEPPYTFSLDTFANGTPPLGMNIEVNGRLVGTPNPASADRTFTFGICVQDRTASRRCGTSSIRVVSPQQGTLATCRGSGQITVTGRLRDPGQPFCQNALPLTTTSSVEIETTWLAGVRQAQVRMEKAAWICRNDQATPVSTFFPPMITLTAASPTSLNGVGSSTDTGGRFDIAFTTNGNTATGTFSRTHVDNALGANWQWSGTFTCTR